jgi:hypothetical protein
LAFLDFSQDLYEVLFGIGASRDFRATLHPGDPEILSIEYTTGWGYPVSKHIRRAQLPGILQTLGDGRLELGSIRPV